MTARLIVGDVRAVLADMPAGSVDLVLTSPPFLALRSYLPGDHPDKHLEIGSEATPGEFIDTLLDVVEACERVLAQHGSMCIELGDTYSGSGGAGGDYGPDGMRGGQEKFKGSALADRKNKVLRSDGNRLQQGDGWPLEKSLCLVPEIFRFALVYGFNPLTGRQTPRWRARNVIRWVRPNPPVGALGDKFRPGTSEMVVICKDRRRYFDLDAVRTDPAEVKDQRHRTTNGPKNHADPSEVLTANYTQRVPSNPAGAPPLDWWKISTQPYSGAWTGDTVYRASRDCPEHSLRAIRQRLDRGSRGELREALLRNSRRTDAGPGVAQQCGRLANGDLDNLDVPATLDWLDRSIQSERTTGSTVSSRTPELPGRSDQGAGAPTFDARTATRTSHMPTGAMSTDQTRGTLPLEYAPSATPHSRASSRTDPAPATTPAGTPSAQTSPHTADISASPGLSVQPSSTPESSTCEDAPGDPSPRTPSRIEGKSALCSCTQFTESASHYATYPEQLCVIPVKAMCPLKVCRTCGAPSERIVSDPEYDRTDSDRVPARLTMLDGERPAEGVNQHIRPEGANTSVVRRVETIGWTDCGHDNWRTGIVLDPFAGSGTTLAVATGHGRDAIGIDLDGRNADLALERVGPLLLAVEHHNQEAA